MALKVNQMLRYHLNLLFGINGGADSTAWADRVDFEDGGGALDNEYEVGVNAGESAFNFFF